MHDDDKLDLERGRKVGRHTIIKRLSVGGMAEVFLAIAEGPGGFKKVVTLKRIHPEHKEDDEFVAMFLEEARISAGLSHAHIAQVFDLGIEDGELFLAMEFVPGEDISHIRRAAAKREANEGRVPVGFVAMVLRDALTALHYAHNFVDASGTKSPIVHRDVSPKNLMVTYTGAVKVIDFGIAKAMNSLGLTQAGLVKGSSGYMAPEQQRGDAVDARADVFSVGVQLHELLTGKRLFPNRTGSSSLAVVDANDVLPPHRLVPGVPEALSDVVMKALHFDAAARFQSAREMARAIGEALSASAGHAMFDDEQAAAYMKDLFRDNMERTRLALQLAGRREDTGRLKAALAALPEDPTTGDSLPSHPDADTLVTVPVPPQRAESSPGAKFSAEASAAQFTAAAQFRAPVVLAVDDSAASLQIFRIHMGRQGFEVVGCASPADALEAVNGTAPDIIVLDVVMPEMDGFELCRRIRELPKTQQVPILFLSAACDIDERTKGLAAGGDDFVRKPYEPDELAARLRAHLARAALVRV